MRISDWSSDVCSSDLAVAPAALGLIERTVCCTEQLQRRRRGLRIERSHAKADGQADALTVAVELKPLDILPHPHGQQHRSEEHTSELQSLMRNSYDVFCAKKKNKKSRETNQTLSRADRTNRMDKSTPS